MSRSTVVRTASRDTAAAKAASRATAVTNGSGPAVAASPCAGPNAALPSFAQDQLAEALGEGVYPNH